MYREYQLNDPSKMGVSHPYIGHLHTPNNALVIPNPDFDAVHHTDGLGFRNAWAWPKTADIVTLGDSLTFGYGVEDADTWPAIIDRALPQLRVVNLGLIGASPEQYVRVYETFGTPLEPKVVIVGMYPDNDFWDAELFATWWESKVGGSYMVWRNLGRLKPTDKGLKRLSKQAQTFLKQHSLLYNLAEYARNLYRGRNHAEPKSLRLDDGSQMYLWPSHFASRVTGATSDQPAFHFVRQALTRLQALTTQQGVRLIVVIQPSKEQVYMPLLGETVPNPNTHLIEALTQLGIDYLDLTPVFQKRAKSGEALFLPRDTHPNRQGYALIAQEILNHIKPTFAKP
jgi:lysophospholipase L1-like esterase